MVAWSTGTPTVATVNASGLISGVAVGQSTVIATVGSKQGQTTVTVTPPPVASVNVTPASPTLVVGTTQQLTAATLDGSGAALTGRVVTWTSSDTAKVTVSITGLVTAVAAGSTTITATSEGKAGTSLVTVIPIPVATVSVTPAAVTLTAGLTQQLTATALDANGNVVTGRTVSWQSSNPSVVTVSSSGLGTAVASGSATITATVDSKQGSASVTVSAAPGYNIEVRYLSDASPRLRSSINAAAARWQSVITGDLPNIPVSLGQGQCLAGAPAINELIDDLLIYVDVVPLSGFSGFTTVCWVRSNGSLPVVAHIQINSADVDRMFVEGWGDNLVLHELGHAVGFLDFIWTRQQLTDFTDPANPLFTGPLAKSAFQALIDGYPPGSAVPLENVGPPGTTRTHWRRSIFDGEVMTHFVYPNSVLSILTVSALQDLGFQVNRSAARPFRGRSGAGVDGVAAVGVEVSEHVAGPFGSIDTRGVIVRYRQ